MLFMYEPQLSQNSVKIGAHTLSHSSGRPPWHVSPTQQDSSIEVIFACRVVTSHAAWAALPCMWAEANTSKKVDRIRQPPV